MVKWILFQSIDTQFFIFKGSIASVPLAISRVTAPTQHPHYPIDNLKDGNPSTFYAANDLTPAKAWVQIELLVENTVHWIRITNRHDCCNGRNLHNMEVRVGNKMIQLSEFDLTRNSKCNTYLGHWENGQVIPVYCSSPLNGKYVTIQALDTTVTKINIAEVTVFGMIFG